MFHKKNQPNHATAAHTHHGSVKHVFYAPEFLVFERGPTWYFVAAVISLGIVAFGILSHAITLVIAYLLFVAVYFLLHHHEAGLTEVALTQHGIRVGDEFFAYGEIKNFWLIWQPPFVADLKLHIKRKLHPVVTIHIFDQDPAQLRALLKPHVAELTDQDEAFTDLVIRALRL